MPGGPVVSELPHVGGGARGQWLGSPGQVSQLSGPRGDPQGSSGQAVPTRDVGQWLQAGAPVLKFLVPELFLIFYLHVPLSSSDKSAIKIFKN